NHLPRRVPLDRFVEYGRWFQKQGVTDLDPRRIKTVERSNGGFKVTTDDGEPILANRVVVATGIEPFAYRPPETQGLSPTFVSHSCDHSDLRRFASKRVLVVGAGQSALESAALLHEGGAEVEVAIRNPNVRWLKLSGTLFRKGVLGKMLYSPRDV